MVGCQAFRSLRIPCVRLFLLLVFLALVLYPCPFQDVNRVSQALHWVDLEREVEIQEYSFYLLKEVVPRGAISLAQV